MVQNDLNIENIVKTIYKLKAGLAAIIGNNDKALKKTKELYYSNSTIYCCEHEKQEI